ncbi:tyrosine/phenylalanine carboxypeptidase domain-containing protein [Arthrobacter sp. D2-10]
MKRNNPVSQLGKRRTCESQTSADTALSTSTAQAFFDGLQSEWTLAEGKRIESSVQKALSFFSPITWTRPLNIADVKKDLATARPYKGSLEYDDVPADEGARAIRNLYPMVEKSEHPAQQAVMAQLRAAEAGCNAFGQLHQLRTNEPVTRWSLEHYGQPSGDTLNVARSILADHDEPTSASEVKLSTHQVVSAFEQQLSTLTNGWTVAIGSIQAAVMVRQSTRQVLVREDLSINQDEVRRLLVHEIGGHVVRALNAHRQEGTLSHLKLGNDSTATEEGLAIWWEHQLGVQKPDVMRRYAARAIAVHLGLQVGATELVEALAPHVGREEAVNIALRVKRGMTNIEMPGAFTKDHCYLTGYLQVAAVLTGTSAQEKIRAAMATKWGLSMLPVAEKLICMGVLAPGATPVEVCHGLAST